MLLYYLSDEYVQYKNCDKFTNHGPNYCNGNNMKLKERYPTFEEMRAKLNLKAIDGENGKLEPIVFRNIGYVSQQETRQRKLDLMRGAKDLIKGIPPTSLTSNYQEIYKYFNILFCFIIL